MPSPVLNIEQLEKRFGDVEVLKDISLSMQKGEFLVLLGPSGCGKSTLLNCIAGLEEISGGVLEIDGAVMNNVPPKDRNIAMVFQSYALYPNMTVAENITFGMKVRREDPASRKAKAAEVARLLQIEALLDRKPAQLSGGQRQRVAMGRALVREPTLFLFDEPLSNLDAKLRVEMRAEIKRVHRVLGASIVYVTHDQIEALTMATKIVVLKGGVVQQVGTPTEIYNHPANTFVADFMGSPPMNLLEAEIVAEYGGCMVTLEGGVQLFDPRPNPSATGVPMPVLLGVRPEHIALGKGKAQATLPVVEVELAGSDKLVQLKAGASKLIARLPADSDIEIGQDVLVSFDMGKACYFSKPSGGRLPCVE
ncbi:MAG: sn-glycerol-3-phosphate ABC transporter ATP-binding protein UgpC [Rhodobacteraceae bacterium]|nr:sn-glycerol-3-phosphate ABC transporter ATP-binding protein UgpC [Paracoccaceae bacterium]